MIRWVGGEDDGRDRYGDYRTTSAAKACANVVGENRELAESLQKRLAAWRKEVGARMPTKNPKYDAERAHQWWSRRNNKPLDIEAMRKHYETRRGKSGR